jgi:hypothetical protein
MAAALHINGERTTGQDVRTQNTMAVVAVANILKTSLGPVGLDKVRRPGAALRRRLARRAPIAPASRPPAARQPPASRPPARRSSLTRRRRPPPPPHARRCSLTTSAT